MLQVSALDTTPPAPYFTIGREILVHFIITFGVIDTLTNQTLRELFQQKTVFVLHMSNDFTPCINRFWIRLYEILLEIHLGL